MCVYVCVPAPYFKIRILVAICTLVEYPPSPDCPWEMDDGQEIEDRYRNRLLEDRCCEPPSQVVGGRGRKGLRTFAFNSHVAEHPDLSDWRWTDIMYTAYRTPMGIGL